MEPIFGRGGETVGWLVDDTIRDASGHPIAFIEWDSLFDYHSRLLGRLSDGFFRDPWGNAVAFLENHSFGPLTPVTRLPPLPPLPSIAPIHPIPPVPPLAPLPTLNWSHLTWDQLMKPDLR